MSFFYVKNEIDTNIIQDISIIQYKVKVQIEKCKTRLTFHEVFIVVL